MKHFTGGTQLPSSADVVVVGTGFASAFFLKGLLRDARDDLRVVVLERGPFYDHMTLIERRDSAEFVAANHYQASGDPEKAWNFKIAFGGSSNCWWGNTPRMLPADFEMKSRFGVGMDWPFSYDELERYYVETERLMQISGAPFAAVPMSSPYPLPPHRPGLPDVLLAKAWPGVHGPMPTARASRTTPTRPQCCANGVCSICPIQAKFSIMTDMMSVFEDPRVTCHTGCEVRSVVTQGNRARGFAWRSADGREGEITGDHLVLAANALFNPAILKRSGDPSPLVGRRLHEQIGLTAQVYLDGVDGFQGSTSVSGMGLQLYDDPERRKTMAAALVELDNIGPMRPEPGRWRQVQSVRLVYEDLPQDENEVRLEGEDDRPIAHFAAMSDYAEKAIARAEDDIAHVFASLPVEKIVIEGRGATESHIQGTTVMGHDPAESVVDQDGLHHRWRDLRVLGSSLFPTGAPANPTLTLSAHALRAADRMETI
jgi:choline dehydrogenase-like flavoprotein